MAERNITRTIVTHTFTIAVYDIENDRRATLTTTRTGGNPDPLKVLDEERRANVGKLVPLFIESQGTTTALYSLPESTFLRYATRVNDPATDGE